MDGFENDNGNLVWTCSVENQIGVLVCRRHGRDGGPRRPPMWFSTADEARKAVDRFALE